MGSMAPVGSSEGSGAITSLAWRNAARRTPNNSSASLNERASRSAKPVNEKGAPTSKMVPNPSLSTNGKESGPRSKILSDSSSTADSTKAVNSGLRLSPVSLSGSALSPSLINGEESSGDSVEVSSSVGSASSASESNSSSAAASSDVSEIVSSASSESESRFVSVLSSSSESGFGLLKFDPSSFAVKEFSSSGCVDSWLNG